MLVKVVNTIREATVSQYLVPIAACFRLTLLFPCTITFSAFALQPSPIPQIPHMLVICRHTIAHQPYKALISTHGH